ncbi:ATP-grasp fold amidoligase family protein [Methylobacterium iners]|uniref:Glycosyltransferase n=1 Tax=Methylobacterium iners TaxID=418707 RepID=A0ABQ4S8I6_9HYPH|nr:ATP-grasp fold amidoligase family protein [Methylobacterium iners]GJD98082.1 hypothetical protein OCOJLMKI_5321 [Methylobacterium iners]
MNLTRFINKYVANDELAVHASHTVCHRRLLNLQRQSTFSERVAYRRLYPQRIFSELSDKVSARRFVSEKVGSKHLVPIYDVTDDIEGINFDNLPNEYVMKANHGAGWVELVSGKRRNDVIDLRNIAGGWLKQNYYGRYRERHYSNIKPKIMFEMLLRDGSRIANDFKIHCFRKGGHLTQFFQIHSNRFGDHKVNFFDVDWRPIPLSHGLKSADPSSIAKPYNVVEMLEVADQLSKNINYVRVDLFLIGSKIYFGELTFTPGAGLIRFTPKELDLHWAKLFDKDEVFFTDQSQFCS